jgi:hypothetical protein
MVKGTTSKIIKVTTINKVTKTIVVALETTQGVINQKAIHKIDGSRGKKIVIREIIGLVRETEKRERSNLLNPRIDTYTSRITVKAILG